MEIRLAFSSFAEEESERERGKEPGKRLQILSLSLTLSSFLCPSLCCSRLLPHSHLHLQPDWSFSSLAFVPLLSPPSQFFSPSFGSLSTNGFFTPSSPSTKRRKMETRTVFLTILISIFINVVTSENVYEAISRRPDLSKVRITLDSNPKDSYPKDSYPKRPVNPCLFAFIQHDLNAVGRQRKGRRLCVEEQGLLRAGVPCSSSFSSFFSFSSSPPSLCSRCQCRIPSSQVRESKQFSSGRALPRFISISQPLTP